MIFSVDGLEKSLIQNNGFNIAAAYGSFEDKTHRGIAFSWNGDHTQCTVNGTNTESSVSNIIDSPNSLPYGMAANSELYFDVRSTSPMNLSIGIRFYGADGAFLGDESYVASAKWILIPGNAMGIRVRVVVSGGSTVENDVISVKIYKNLPNNLLETKVAKVPEFSGSPAVGQIFRVSSVGEDGKVTMEPVDMPNSGGVQDVQIQGSSIVKDGVAQLPIGSKTNVGMFEIGSGFRVSADGKLSLSAPPTYGLSLWGDDLGLSRTSSAKISNRSSLDLMPITTGIFDYAVKAAMCDGKGNAWTDVERLAALFRMGCTVDDNGFVKWTAQEVAE